MNLKSNVANVPVVSCLRLVLVFLFVCAVGHANALNLNAPCERLVPQAKLPSRGIPFDWSHRHVVGTVDATGVAGRREHRLLYSQLRAYKQNCSSRPAKSSTQHIDWDVPLGAAMADGAFPAKYNFGLPGQTPSCSDFVVYGLNVSGVTGGQPNLVGETNLYSGGASVSAGLCNGNTGVAQKLYGYGATVYAATVKFAYNGSTTVVNGAITNSIVMSEDGLHIAYVESNPTKHRTAFHVVPTTPNASSPGAVGWNGMGTVVAASVAPPSIATVPSSGYWGAADSYSSIWIDYANDLAYFGTDDGTLHKIQNVFCTTAACLASPVAPSEVTTGLWPLTLTGAGALTSPVEDANGVLYLAGANGYLYAVSSAGAINNKSTSAFTASSIYDAPILDEDSNGVTQALYWFAASSSTYAYPQMVQTGASLSVNTANIFPLLLNVPVSGQNSWGGAVHVHSGIFDNSFYTSRNGNMWACGWYQESIYGSNNANQQGVVRFGMNGTAVTEDTSKLYATLSPEYLSAADTECAPITEVVNSAGVDQLFISVNDGLSQSTGTCVSNAACLTGFTLGSSGSPVTYSLSLTGSYSLASSDNSSAPYNTFTSGIIVDNTVDPTSSTCGTGSQTCGQTASIYFNYGTDAIKLTQAALQ